MPFSGGPTAFLILSLSLFFTLAEWLNSHQWGVADHCHGGENRLLRFVAGWHYRRFVLPSACPCEDDFLCLVFRKGRAALDAVFVVVEEGSTLIVAVGGYEPVHVKLLLYKSNCRRYV